MDEALDKVGIDISGLIELSDDLFKEHEALPFSDFMGFLLQLRGSQQATVKDVVEMRRFFAKQQAQTNFLIHTYLGGNQVGCQRNPYGRGSDRGSGIVGTSTLSYR